MSSDVTSLLEGKTIAVTGAGGLVGHAVVSHLLGARARVIGIGRAHASPVAGIAWVSADITRPGALARALDGSDACIHLAGRKSARVAPEAVYEAFVQNTVGTLEIAEACRRSGVPRIVLASTGHVYAPRDEGLIAETDPVAPRSAYAASKVAAEVLLVGYGVGAGLACAFARISNVYGVTEPDTIIGRALHQALAGQPIALRTHDAVRDFIHLDDVASALAALAVCPLVGAEAFNVASGEALSSGEVARRVAAAAARAGRGPVEVLPPEANEPPGLARYAFHTDRLRSRTGHVPRLTLDEVLDRAFARA